MYHDHGDSKADVRSPFSPEHRSFSLAIHGLGFGKSRGYLPKNKSGSMEQPLP